ncbi:MAG: (2Fe-2S)-binding protein [Deltaproteobacteria bacterium]|nr:(2Fe-2S)-binding protein [Deltaproteobacteria bacterium]
MTTLLVNGTRHEVDADPEMPLLWVLRDLLGLTGTKYACGKGLCGSCAVLVDGEAVRSCTIPMSALEGKAITTIEGLSPDGTHPLQVAWVEGNVSQCGYCQPGQILAAVALLSKHARPSDAQIDAAMEGHLCRCGTYLRIREAIHRVAGEGSP